jgi:hypothetical protein
MPIPIRCSGCDTRLNVPDAAAGKLVKCPKCETRLKVPALKVAEEPEPEELIEEELQPLPKKKAARPVEDDSDDEPPAQKKNRRPRDEDEEEEEEDERPRKKKTKAKAKKGSNKVLLLVLAAVGGLVLLGGGGVAAIYFMSSDNSKPLVKNGGPAGPPLIINPKAEFKIELVSTIPNNNAFVKQILLTPDGRHAVMSVANAPSQIWELDATPKLKSKVADGNAVAVVNGGQGVLVQSPTGKHFAISLATGEKLDGPITGMWRNGDLGMCLSNSEGEFYWSSRHMNWKPVAFQIAHRKPNGGDIVKEYEVNPDSFVLYSPPVNGGRELVFGDQKLNVVKVFDFEKKVVTRQFSLPKGSPGKIAEEWQLFATSADGKIVAVRRDYNNVEFVDQNGSILASLPNLFHSGFYPDRFLGQGHLFVTSALPPGETRNESSRGIYDIDKKAFVGVVRGPAGKLERMATSDDGGTLVFYYSDRPACVFDLTQLK